MATRPLPDNDEQSAIERFEAIRALDELKRRYPDADWRIDIPCPDCGSVSHFECDGSGIV